MAKLSDEQKQQIIAEALETEDGRAALAQAMVEPIKRELEYSGIARKLLMVDEVEKVATYVFDPDKRFELLDFN